MKWIYITKPLHSHHRPLEARKTQAKNATCSNDVNTRFYGFIKLISELPAIIYINYNAHTILSDR